MKKLLQISLWLSLVLPAMSQPILNVDWNELAKKNELLGGQIISTSVSTGEVATLKIENMNDAPLQLSLFKILNPAIKNLTYGFVGQIKYENVRGNGYLEMWNYFPPSQAGTPETKYFSRTLEAAGAMGKITGSSDWRMFSLPFDANGAVKPPSHLEFNIFLPARGTVCLRNVILCQYKGNGLFPVASNSWWSEKEAPWVGGIGGPIIGCFGGLLGWLSGKGKARRLVLAIWKFWIVTGILFLIAAVIALVSGQPFYVSMPLLIFGIVPTTVFGILWPTAKKRYDDLEIRRMASIDAMGS